MNCHDFEAIVTELARRQLMPVETSERALAHAEACGRCAERLAEEERLAAELRALAAATATKQAPPGLETTLRAAFRKQHRDRRAPAWAIPVGVAAVAASIVLVFAWGRRGDVERLAGPVPPKAAQEAQPAPLAPPAATPAVPETGRVGKAARRQNVSRKSSAPTRAVDEGEIVTPFVPLVENDDPALREGRQVVRIRLPRSALRSFGFPVNEDRAAERIRADVLLGEDGVAQAIRFVK